MKNKTIRFLAAAMLACVAPSVRAMPVSIAYQGVLRGAKGEAIPSLHQTVEFRLYKSASGPLTDALWGRSVAVLLDTNGLFNVALEDGNGAVLESTLHTNLVDALRSARSSSLFVGLNVLGSSGEIAPRQQILTVPYAAYAQDVDAAAGDFSVAGRAQIQTLEVKDRAVFRGAAEFADALTVGKKLIVSGGLEVAAPQAIAGYGTIPVGGIILWSGRDVPEGWSLCDGSNGTPNLVDRFVMGSGTGDAHGHGGSKTVTLSTDNLPPHRHEYFGDDQIEGRDGETTAVSRRIGNYDADSKLKGESKVYLSGSTGGGKAIDILPPYYRLAYIMRIK